MLQIFTAITCCVFLILTLFHIPLLTCEVAGSDRVEQAELLVGGGFQPSSSACSRTHRGGTVHCQSFCFIHQPVHQVTGYKQTCSTFPLNDDFLFRAHCIKHKAQSSPDTYVTPG